MNKPPSNKGKSISRVNALSFAQLVKFLNEGLYSCKELASLTGLHYVTVLDHTRAMYKAKAIHICEWETDSRGRAMIKIYKMGEGKDAKRPKLSGAQRSLAYRAKQSQLETLRRLNGQEP